MGLFNRNKKLYAVTKEKIVDVSEIKEQIQGMSEGDKIDILSTLVTQSGSYSTGSTSISENNYPTYEKQVQIINQMYNNQSKYGGELLRALLHSVVSFIAGEGISIDAKGKTLKFLENLFETNKMQEGSRLLNEVLLGEMEGKCLLWLVPKDKEIKINYFSYFNTPYKVEYEASDIEEYTKAVVTLDKKKGNQDGNQKTLNSNEFVYIKLGGSPDRVNDTPPTVANVLTDIENYSRAKYDMRNNNHLFGRVSQIFLVENLKEAQSLQNKINSMNNVIGRSYAGTAKQVFYLEPSGNSQKVLHEEMVDLLRIIATNLGIPIQLVNHPELMSNRATAENMLEMTNSATIQKRLIWEEALTDVARKAMIMATDKGMEGAVNDPDGFQIKLNFATLALLKQIAEVWIPLVDGRHISETSFLSRLPGINVNKELALLEKEKEKRMEDMPSVFKGNNINSNNESSDSTNDQDGSQEGEDD